MSSSSESSGKYTNDRYPQKIGKIDSLRKRALNAESQNIKLREKIRKINTSEGEVVDDDLHCHLVDIMGENHMHKVFICPTLLGRATESCKCE